MRLSKPAMLTTLALCAAMTLVPATALAQYSTPVRDVENPEKTPFTMGYTCNGTGYSNIECTSITANMPAGYRFVIETETYSLTVANATYIVPRVQALADESANVIASIFLPLAQAGISATGVPMYANLCTARIYAEAKPTVSVDSYGGTVKGAIWLHGHLVKK